MAFKNKKAIFVDTSAFKALFDFSDEFHKKAENFFKKIKKEKIVLITSNFILDETYTLIRVRMGKPAALQFHQDLINSFSVLKVKRITLSDEQKAWRYFAKLPGRGMSFTDCTSFALMKRLGIKNAFTFDNDFAKAGFKILP